MRVKDLTGETFGMLRVLALDSVSPGKARIARWLCQCECGNRKVIYANALRSGGTTSCGCNKRAAIGRAMKRHGMRNSPEYRSWRSMLARCYNRNDPHFDAYGGRGIMVDVRWISSFEAFYQDMGNRPAGKTLERSDVNGHYTKDNCTWATPKEQAANRRSTVRVTFRGESMPRVEFARRCRVSDSAVRARLLKGESPEAIHAHYVEGSLCA